jgi:hypothetical protein
LWEEMVYHKAKISNLSPGPSALPCDCVFRFPSSSWATRYGASNYLLFISIVCFVVLFCCPASLLWFLMLFSSLCLQNIVSAMLPKSCNSEWKQCMLTNELSWPTFIVVYILQQVISSLLLMAHIKMLLGWKIMGIIYVTTVVLLMVLVFQIKASCLLGSNSTA